MKKNVIKNAMTNNIIISIKDVYHLTDKKMIYIKKQIKKNLILLNYLNKKLIKMLVKKITTKQNFIMNSVCYIQYT